MDESTYAAYAQCDNCGMVFQYAAQDLDRIPGLLQRIEAGGEVPVAACPQCGALAYVVREPSLPVYVVETGWSCHRRSGELLVLVHEEKRDFPADFAEVLREAQQAAVDGAWTYDDDIVPRLLEKGYRLARFQVVAGE